MEAAVREDAAAREAAAALFPCLLSCSIHVCIFKMKQEGREEMMS
jgi:hypothetical protein